jgi:hypothetical protein
VQAHIPPSPHWFTAWLALLSRHCILYGFPSNTAMRREPLCLLKALPLCSVMFYTTSEGVTLPSSSYWLMRQTKFLPPSSLNYYDMPSQVVAPAWRDWKMALPDIISAILAQAPGPLPRSVLSVRLLASSRKTTASHPTSHVRHTEKYTCNATSTEKSSRGCSHSLIFRLPRSLVHGNYF